MSVCKVSRDKNNIIQEVYAPNSKPSILYRDALKSLSENSDLKGFRTSDQAKELALRFWAKAYTPSFIRTFGNWQSETAVNDRIFNGKLDTNGEPIFSEVYNNNDNPDQSNKPLTTSRDESDEKIRTEKEEENRVKQEDKNKSKKTKAIDLLNKLSKKFNIPFKIDDSLKTIATVRNGEVLVNSNLIAPDTAFHEYSHFFVEAIRLTNPALFKNLASRAKEFEYRKIKIIDFIRDNQTEEEKKNQSEDEFNSEVITTAIALEAGEKGSVANGNTQNRMKFVKWMTTVFEKISEYFNKLTKDKYRIISPEELNPEISLQNLAELLHLENPIDVSSVSKSFSANQAASMNSGTATATGALEENDDLPEVDIYGSVKSTVHFEKLAQKIELNEDENGDSYYTDGTIDKETGKLKRFERLTEFKFQKFVPDKEGLKRTEKFRKETSLDKATELIFIKNNASLDEKIPYGESEKPLSFQEIKELKRKEFNIGRALGNIMHKMIEGYTKHNDKDYFSQEIEKYREEADIDEFALNWFTTERIVKILGELRLNTKKTGKDEKQLRDNISSELKMVSEVFNIGTAIDMFIEHSNGDVSMTDFKTGRKFLNDMSLQRPLLYSNGTVSPLYNTEFNKAGIDMVMRMIMIKLEKPETKIRDLKIIHVSKNYGDFVMFVNVQKTLDYIENNYRINIQQLEHEVKKSKGTDQESIKALEQSKKELKAMQDGKVFDFNSYEGDSHFFANNQEEKFDSDKARIEALTKQISEATAKSLVKNKEVTKSTIDSIKEKVFEVLNSFKSSNIANVQQSGSEDIGQPEALLYGNRNMSNSYIQSFNLATEEANDRVTELRQKYLGERSPFQIANKALYAEYAKDHGTIKGALAFSYPSSNIETPKNKQGIFDFMYTWKNIAGTPSRIGAVYTEADVKSGKITQVQYNYYRAEKNLLKELYDTVGDKVLYTYGNKNVTYREEYAKEGSFSYKEFDESFLPIAPFQGMQEILDKNIQTGNINPLKIAKEAIQEYQERYDLSIQNKQKFRIGLPLKYMSSEFISDDDHSFDVTASTTVFANHMIDKLVLDELYNLGTATVEVMKTMEDPTYVDANGKSKIENSIFALESYINQNILKRKKETFKYSKNDNFNKGADRFIDFIGGFISKNTFWLAPVVSVANGIYNVLTVGKEALIGSLAKRLYGEENGITLSILAKALRVSTAHTFSNYTKNGNIVRQVRGDFKQEYYKDKVNFMFKKFRLGNKDFSYNDHSLLLGRRNRTFTGDNAYFMQGLSEDLTNESFMIATLLAKKIKVSTIDENGKLSIKYLKKDGSYTTDSKDSNLENMWDIYKYNEGTGEYDYTGPVRFKDKNGEDVTGLTTTEHLSLKTYLERIFGAYSPEQRTHLERYALGRMIMKFRKYQIMNVTENFTMKSYKKYVGEYQLLTNPDGSPKLKDGQPMYDWKSEQMFARFKLFTFLMGSFLNTKNAKTWEQMSPEEKKQLTRLAIQISLLTISFVIAMGGLIPPEDKNKLWAKRVIRMVDDISTINPYDLLQGTTTINSFPKQLLDFANSGATYFHSYLTNDKVTSGDYKGDYKGENTFEGFIPIYRSYKQAEKLVSGK